MQKRGDKAKQHRVRPNEQIPCKKKVSFSFHSNGASVTGYPVLHLSPVIIFPSLMLLIWATRTDLLVMMRFFSLAHCHCCYTLTVIRWSLWTSSRVAPDRSSEAHAKGCTCWVVQGCLGANPNHGKTSFRGLTMAHHSWIAPLPVSDLGMLPVMEPCSCLLDSHFRFLATPGVECMDDLEWSLWKPSISDHSVSSPRLAAWSWPMFNITVIPKPGEDCIQCAISPPVSLMNADAKILTAIVANRHQKVLAVFLHLDRQYWYG